MDYKVIYFGACEVGIPNDYFDVDSCNKPAIAKIVFNEKDSIYVCEEHLEEIIKELEDV